MIQSGIQSVKGNDVTSYVDVKNVDAKEVQITLDVARQIFDSEGLREFAWLLELWADELEDMEDELNVPVFSENN